MLSYRGIEVSVVYVQCKRFGFGGISLSYPSIMVASSGIRSLKDRRPNVVLLQSYARGARFANYLCINNETLICETGRRLAGAKSL